MSTFKDSQDRTWDISLTVGRVEELAKYYNVDPDKVLKDTVSDVLFRGTYIDLAVLFWGLLKSQAEEFSVTQEQFKDQDPSFWEDAAVALEQAVVDFTRPSQRPVIEKTLAKAKELQGTMTQKAMEKLDDPEVEKTLLDQMQVTLDHSLKEITPDLLRETSVSATG